MVDDIVRAGNTFKLVVDEEFGGHSGDPRSIFASLRAAGIEICSYARVLCSGFNSLSVVQK